MGEWLGKESGRNVHGHPTTCLTVVLNDGLGTHLFFLNSVAGIPATHPTIHVVEVVDLDAVVVRGGGDLAARVERRVRHGQTASMLANGFRLRLGELAQIPQTHKAV